MAQGTLTLFNEYAKSSRDGRIDIDTDTIKVALTSTVPLATDAVPTWGAGGTTNESSNEVSAGGGYTAGGIALSGGSFGLTSNVAKFDATDILWTSSASGDPTNIKTAIIYSDTATNKDCIGFIDMTADGGTTAISMLTGDVGINWNSGGIETTTV